MSESRRFAFGDSTFTYRIRRSDRRLSFGVVVDPSEGVILHVPRTAKEEQIEEDGREEEKGKVDHIRQEIRRVDFWLRSAQQDALRDWISVEILDHHHIVPYERQLAVADRLMELVKARQAALR